VLRSLGFAQLRCDSTVFFHKGMGVLIDSHVDDLKVAGKEKDVDKTFELLGEQLMIKRMPAIGKEWSRYLGKEWRRLQGQLGFAVRPLPKHVQELAEMAGVADMTPVTTPMSDQEEENDTPLDAEGHKQYRAIVGKLQWLAPERLDVAYAVKERSRKLHAPTKNDMAQAVRIIRYLLGTADFELHLVFDKGQTKNIVSFSDSDWGKGDSRRSTSSGMVTWGNFLVQSFSRTQGVVALSSCEAEMIAMTSTTAESIFTQSLLTELGYEDLPIVLRGDSSSALTMMSRTGVGRMRHISIKLMWLQDQTQSGNVILEKMAGLKNPSDLGTKSHKRARLIELLDMVGLKKGQGHREINMVLKLPEEGTGELEPDPEGDGEPEPDQQDIVEEQEIEQEQQSFMDQQLTEGFDMLKFKQEIAKDKEQDTEKGKGYAAGRTVRMRGTAAMASSSGGGTGTSSTTPPRTRTASTRASWKSYGITPSQKELIEKLCLELDLEEMLVEIMQELCDRGDASTAIAELLAMKRHKRELSRGSSSKG